MVDELQILRDIEYLIERGTPWVEGSDDPRVGLDCVTFVATIYDRLGWPAPMPVGYSADAGLAAEGWGGVLEHFELVDEPEVWSVAVFPEPHVGLVVPRSRLAHCQRGRGVTLSRLGPYAARAVGFLRLHEIPEPSSCCS